MFKSMLKITLFTITTSLMTTMAWAADDTIYGSQLMTQQERLEYRQKHMNAKTMEERERIRKEHHALMQKRAKERNVELPDEPPSRGMGESMNRENQMHPGTGMGGGMGSGGPRR